MRRTGFVALAAATMLVAGCGGDEDGSGSATPASNDAMEKPGGAGMKSDGAMKGDGAMKDDGAMESDAAMKAGAAMAESARRTRRGKVVKVIRSSYGRVIADGKGEAFYLFDKETGPKSRCYGACAVAWPPVLTKGRPRAGRGARARLLGTTRRRGGRRQVTYAGQPLYYYKDDAPGTILCHNVEEFGGLWLVVKPNGRAVG